MRYRTLYFIVIDTIGPKPGFIDYNWFRIYTDTKYLINMHLTWAMNDQYIHVSYKYGAGF
jgi:hypothetical protein